MSTRRRLDGAAQGAQATAWPAPERNNHADTHCITCSDEGVPMRVLEVQPDGIARCAGADGAPAEVMVDLVGRVAPGDTLLVHAGVALLAADAERPRR